jgi:hypothetical protein
MDDDEEQETERGEEVEFAPTGGRRAGRPIP